MHRNPQGKWGETSCQGERAGIEWRQIEPGSLKNFAAQLKEGARAERFMRPQFFLGEESSGVQGTPRAEAELGSRPSRLEWGWIKPGSLRCVTRRAKERRGGKSRATPVGMTIKERSKRNPRTDLPGREHRDTHVVKGRPLHRQEKPIQDAGLPGEGPGHPGRSNRDVKCARGKSSISGNPAQAVILKCD